MKKLLAFILILALCILPACKKKDKVLPSADPSAGESSAASSTVDSSEVPSAEDSSAVTSSEESSDTPNPDPPHNEYENTFTVGNVNIALYEANIHRSADSYLANGTEGFLPEGYAGGTPTDDQIIAAAALYQNYLAKQKLMPGVAINKMPYVKNTGSFDAYVRIRVMIPSVLELDCKNSSMYCTSALSSGEFSLIGNWDTPVTTTLDGVKYDVYTFMRNKALTSGEMTYWNVWNTITMNADTTIEDYNAYVTAGAIDENGMLNVYIQADAIQATGFENATQAFEAFDSVYATK